jgi:tripartite-type tricarboxylate transporter receptor subunit TctC
MNRLRRLCLAAFALASCFSLLPAAAQDAYPSRPIKLIVPYNPGGSTDLLARILAERLSTVLGQQIVVENIGGAGSTIGTSALARAVPDGYTIGLLDTAFAINPGLYAKLPYDTLKDFEFPSVVATASGVLVVNAKKVKAQTVPELISEAKAAPAPLTFASAGAGTVIHLHGEVFKSAAGISLLHVPYKGAGPATVDLLSGQVDMMFHLPGLVVQQVKAGQLRPLAVTGNKRSPLFPNVPTFAEAGFADVNAVSLWVLAGPKGLASAVQDKLAAAVAKAMDSPDIQTKLAENAFDTTVIPRPQSAAFLDQQIRKFSAAVKASGATAN